MHLRLGHARTCSTQEDEDALVDIRPVPFSTHFKPTPTPPTSATELMADVRTDSHSQETCGWPTRTRRQGGLTAARPGTDTTDAKQMCDSDELSTAAVANVYGVRTHERCRIRRPERVTVGDHEVAAAWPQSAVHMRWAIGGRARDVLVWPRPRAAQVPSVP